MAVNNSYSVVFIGSGNVATHLAKALSDAGHRVTQVYSRSLENAKLLAEKHGAAFTDNLSEINRDANLYIFAVKDDALSEIAAQMPSTSGVWVHTAGSLPLSVLSCREKDFGVFYPLQTFSKGRELDFAEIPIFIESDNSETVSFLQEIGQSISSKVKILSSEKRKYLHLAAVFACNFTNHLYAVASEIVESQGMSFDVLHALISETATKAKVMNPVDSQTGPAVRFDKTVMQNHLQLLPDTQWKEIYQLLSKSIYETSKKRKK